MTRSFTIATFVASLLQVQQTRSSLVPNCFRKNFIVLLRRLELIIIRAGVTEGFLRQTYGSVSAIAPSRGMSSTHSCPATQPMSVAAHVCFASALLQQSRVFRVQICLVCDGTDVLQDDAGKLHELQSMK